MRCVIACVLVGLLAPAVGCKDEESHAPPPPSGGGTVGPIGSGGRPNPDDDEDEDGGAAGTDAAAGGGDSGMLPEECQNVPVVQVPMDELPPGTEASTTAPADFEVSRLVGSWQGGCERPEFVVEMSEGGCPDGRDHALTFAIDAASLVDGSLRLGLNTISPEPNDLGLRIRYVRPEALTPDGEWGTCTGAAGMFDVGGDPPSSEAGTTLEFRFSLELTACDGSDAPVQDVSGTFLVMVRRSFSDVCPDL